MDIIPDITASLSNFLLHVNIDLNIRRSIVTIYTTYPSALEFMLAG